MLLADRSLRNIAYKLANFVEWCEANGTADHKTRDVRLSDWRSLTYDDILQYQREQRSGAWSNKNQPLDPNTANARADQATDFLLWAASRKLRDAFEVKLTTSRRNVRAGSSSKQSLLERKVRVGREKPSRSKALRTALYLPKVAEVRDWLRAVRERRGLAKYLACRSILEIGMRRHELCALTEDQWPTKETLDYLQSRGEPVAATELIVTKGSVPRDVSIPLSFAIEVRDWIDGPRLRLNREFYKRTMKRASRQLFLSDARGYEGIALQTHTIYDCFHEVTPCPPRWSPHLGRHVFACFYVLQALE